MDPNEGVHDNDEHVPDPQILQRIHSVYDHVTDRLHDTYEAAMTSILDAVYVGTRSILDIALSSLIPLAKIAIVSLVLLFTSLIAYTLLHRYLLPKDMINEPLYFNYNEKSPIARVHLLSEEKQWDYYRSGEVLRPKTCSAFFKTNGNYDISLRFAVSKSPRNQESRRCMVTVSMIDCQGDVLAQSSRPLIVPYHSHATSILDVLIFWPKYLISGETEHISLHMMNNFRETRDLNIPTSHIEVVLSSHDLDIEHSTLTILPLPVGITYVPLHHCSLYYLICFRWFIYHFPSMTFASGIGVFFVLQAGLVVVYLVVRKQSTYDLPFNYFVGCCYPQSS